MRRALRDAADYGMIGLLSGPDYAGAAPPPISGPDIEPAMIRSIVRGNFGALRRCYEAELAKDPTLAGRIVTRLQIGVDGKVKSVSDAGSDPAMAQAAACVWKEFAAMEFPARASGELVTVTYPIMFSPGN